MVVSAEHKRGKTCGVIAGLVPAISIGMAQCSLIGMAGTSPAMTKWELPRLLPLLPIEDSQAPQNLFLRARTSANT